MNKQDRYLYLHIPKTGGVSFRQVIENAFHVNEVLHVLNPKEILEHTDDSLARYRFVHGHFSAFHVEHLYSFKKITSLRDPVARCLSAYDFWRGLTDSSDWPENSRAQIRRSKAFSLEELIDFPDWLTSKHFNNHQVRMLRGAVEETAAVTAEHLAMALKNLESFSFIALNEQLQQSREMLCLKFGFFLASSSVRLNQSSNRSSVLPELIEKLTVANSLDIQLLQSLRGRGLAAINNIDLSHWGS
ncbi:MAG: sulfotransferase family 2 domain-containing protein [Pseudomonas sp.]|uniref:sulfotransferase family 2 domain-containing protein n=1 Tax=Pseudomonas sp. TaxID=306 RepID=UPI0033919E7E